MSIDESSINWIEDGQRAVAATLNRPGKQIVAAINVELDKKINIDSIATSIGSSDTHVMSQKAVTNAISSAASGAAISSTDSLTEGSVNLYFTNDRVNAVVNRNTLNISEVNNTSDANKPLSNSTIAALEEKVNIDNKSLMRQLIRGTKDKWIDSKTLKDYNFKHSQSKLLGRLLTQNWVTDSITGNNTWEDIVYSNELNLFVAVSSTGTGRVATSSNGITWASVTVPSIPWKSVTWSPELMLFVLVGHGSILTSANGSTWTSPASTVPVPSNNWECVEWNEDSEMFFGVASNTTNNVIISEDGIEWETINTTHNFPWKSISINYDGLMAAVASNKIMVSDNWNDWVLKTPPAGNNWEDITYSPDLDMFVAVSSNGTNRIMISYYEEVYDVPSPGNEPVLIETKLCGDEWNLITAPAQYAWKSVEWINDIGMFVAISSTGVMISEDGKKWDLCSNVISGSWKTSAWSRNLSRLVVVGTGSTVLSSYKIESTNQSQMLLGTDTSRFINSASLEEFNKFKALTNWTIDLNNGRNWKRGIDADSQLENPINMREGQTGKILITQSAAYFLTFGTVWKIIGTNKEIANNTGKVSVINYTVIDSNTILATIDNE